MKFRDLNLSAPVLRAVDEAGYQTPTPIQAQAIGPVLEGRDVLGCAQTGTGKTAAFALPILDRLTADKPKGKRPTKPRCLVLSPTRELATQIAGDFKTYGKHTPLRGTIVFGGVGQRPQVTDLRRGIDILIATPGRLLDLINQGHADLSNIQTLVLDEADRMLDMGFIPDIRRIVSYVPERRQTLMFSATMPREIRKLADAWLVDPVTIQIAPEKPAADRVNQSVYFVERQQKPDRLADLMDELGMHRVIVFTRTKHGADKLVKKLKQRGIRSEAIHGNKSQNARTRAMDNFKRDKVGVLVATDIAARGIDVDNVSHVVNYDLTHEPETYVHRIGRTARAGAEGAAVSLCDREEMGNLRAIEKLLKMSITVAGETPAFAEPRGNGGGKSKGRGGNGRSGSGSNRGQGGGRPRRRRSNRRGGKSAVSSPR